MVIGRWAAGWRRPGRRIGWLLAGAGLALAGPSAQAADRMADLKLFFGGSTRMNASGVVELIAYFNSIARDDDGYMLTESSLLGDPANHAAAIAQIQRGLRVQNFASWQTAMEQLEPIAQTLDAISYDLEKWDQSRGEWADIDAASANMGAITATYGLFYIGHLSNQLADRNSDDPLSIEHMAAHADAYSPSAYPCLEVYDMDQCVADMREMILRAKAGNPTIEIHVGISLEKDFTLEQQYRYIEGNLDLTDGITIFIYPNRAPSVQRLKDFIRLLRGRPAADFDLDFDVDADDFVLFAGCFSGPSVDADSACRPNDLDADGDVDQSDFSLFQRCYRGSGNPANPGCAD